MIKLTDNNEIVLTGNSQMPFGLVRDVVNQYSCLLVRGEEITGADLLDRIFAVDLPITPLEHEFLEEMHLAYRL